MPVHLGTDAVAGYGLKPCNVTDLDAPLASPGDYGLGQWVLGALFRRGDEAQEVILAPVTKSEDIREGGLPFGEGAGLVEDDGLHLRL